MTEGPSLPIFSRSCAFAFLATLVVAGLRAQQVQLIKDFHPTGSTDVFVRDLEGTAYVTAAVPGIGLSLWKSDGTTAGTVLVKQLAPKPVYNPFAGPIPVGNLVFSGSSELWRTDGTPQGTFMVKDIHKSGGSFPSSLTRLGTWLIFYASDSIGPAVWRSDGTAKGTIQLRRGFPEGASERQIARLGNEAFFAADKRLQATDGTVTGSRDVLDQNGAKVPAEGPLVRIGNAVYFVGGNQLWRSNGTRAGTAPLLQFVPSNLPRWADIHAGRTSVYFTIEAGLFAPGAPKTASLFVSDGTSKGTRHVKTWSGNPAFVGSFAATVAGDDLFFHINSTLHRYDYAQQKLLTLKPMPWFNHSVSIGSQVYFGGLDTQNGAELWTSDGTPQGTRILKDLYPGFGWGSPSRLTPIGGGRFLFLAEDPKHGIELWISDGTVAGTRLFVDLNPGTGSGFRTTGFWLALSSGRLLAGADNGKTGRELFAIDIGPSSQDIGTGCGTQPRLEVTPLALGTMARVTVDSVLANAQGLLLVGIPGSRPTVLGPDCSLYVDISKPTVPVAFSTDKSGRWQLSARVPNDPSAKGALLVAQCAVGQTTTVPLGTDLSHAVYLAVR